MSATVITKAQEIQAKVAGWSRPQLNTHINSLLTKIFKEKEGSEERKRLELEAQICAHLILRRNPTAPKQEEKKKCSGCDCECDEEKGWIG